MAQMARYTPAMVERRFEEYRYILEAMDTVDRSLRFFYEYEGKDKAKNIVIMKKDYQKLCDMLAYASPPKSIGKLKKENHEATLDHIVMMIMEVKMFFMVDRSITEEAAYRVANLMLSEFPYLTLEEICLCFNSAMKGHYGEDYQRLDGPTFMRWLQRYVKERTDRLAEKEYAKRVQHRAGNDGGRHDAQRDNQTKLQEAILWRLRKK